MKDKNRYLRKIAWGAALGAVSLSLILGPSPGLWKSPIKAQALVLKADAEPGTVISLEMLTVKGAGRVSLGAYRLENVERVLGRETNMFIPAGMELSPGLFRE